MTLRFSLIGLCVLLLVSGMASLSAPAAAPEDLSSERVPALRDGPSRPV